ncbi:hypothetical protein [Paenibacillus sp. 481]|uniref:hypothetical protein n=1 Tax=Paenibacillus sp. 481 TaxID=2835869 RepID=UPI001E38CC42|nr:hypothetical protein [Paenibacillus sp. 481]
MIDQMSLTRTDGKHGTGEISKLMGAVSGVVFKNPVVETYKEAPQATIIVSHLEALNHSLLTRAELNHFIDEQGHTTNILVPNDGDSIAIV